MVARRWLPVAMGVVMGAMMLWMVHGAVSKGSGTLGPVLGFAALHVFVAGIGLLLTRWAAAFSPGMTAFFRKLHRPRAHHLVVMLSSAAATAAIVHLILHWGM